MQAPLQQGRFPCAGPSRGIEPVRAARALWHVPGGAPRGAQPASVARRAARRFPSLAPGMQAPLQQGRFPCARQSRGIEPVRAARALWHVPGGAPRGAQPSSVARRAARRFPSLAPGMQAPLQQGRYSCARLSELLHADRTSDTNGPQDVGSVACVPHFRRQRPPGCRKRRMRAALPTPHAPSPSARREGFVSWIRPAPGVTLTTVSQRRIFSSACGEQGPQVLENGMGMWHSGNCGGL